MNKYLIVLMLGIASIYGINNWLDSKKEEMYQQAALRCALQPEGLNCGQFSTAAAVVP